MRKQKYYLAIDDYGHSVIIDSLNNLRNKLIADGRYTVAVDELIIKFAHAPIKKVTEQLKSENQMLWMHQMNNIHNRVMEIINTDLIYV